MFRPSLVQSSRLIPGFEHLYYRMIIQTPAGRIVFSSGEKAGEVSGALKHLVNEIMRRTGGAGGTELAEAVAIKELSAIGKAIGAGEAKAGANGYLMVRTEGALWEVKAGVDAETGLTKIFHLVPKEIF